MTLAIEELEHKSPLGRDEVDAFLEGKSFPLVEGSTVTFVYRGEADSVHLRHWIYGLSSAQPFVRLDESDLWFLMLELPEGSRAEYKLELVRGGQTSLIQDPLNPHLAHDPYGANSVVHAAGYEVPDWSLPDPEARAGRVDELVFGSDAFADVRPVQIYLPALFRETRRYPLLIVHDGADFLRFSNLQTVLDNLIDRLEITPMIVALIDSPRRLEEYADDDCVSSCTLLPDQHCHHDRGDHGSSGEE